MTALNRGKHQARRRQIRLFLACRSASPTPGNSLAAVRKLCSTKIGQQQLATALAEDFAGLDGEQLRQRLLNAAPKYGNDVDEVDRLLVRAYQTYIEEPAQYRNTRFGRGPITGGAITPARRFRPTPFAGAATLATPDGRKAGAPLAEGASPASGTTTGADGGVHLPLLPTEAIPGGVLLNQS